MRIKYRSKDYWRIFVEIFKSKPIELILIWFSIDLIYWFDLIEELSSTSNADHPSTDFPDDSSDTVKKDWKLEKQSNYLEEHFANKE